MRFTLEPLPMFMVIVVIIGVRATLYVFITLCTLPKRSNTLKKERVRVN